MYVYVHTYICVYIYIYIYMVVSCFRAGGVHHIQTTLCVLSSTTEAVYGPQGQELSPLSRAPYHIFALPIRHGGSRSHNAEPESGDSRPRANGSTGLCRGGYDSRCSSSTASPGTPGISQVSHFAVKSAYKLRNFIRL